MYLSLVDVSPWLGESTLFLLLGLSGLEVDCPSLILTALRVLNVSSEILFSGMGVS